MLQEFLGVIAIKVTNLISSLGYWGIFLAMAVESFNVPIPSEIIHPYAGYLVSTGQFNFLPAILAGALGGLTGSIASYYLGRYLMDSPLLFFISVQRRQWLIEIFEHYGEGIVFFGRLLPMVRTVISLPAGAARMNIWRFITYTLAGSLIWATLFTYLGYFLGKNWSVLSRYFHEADLVILLVLGLGLAYLLWRKSKRS
ncbi:MAG: DedA family protein [Methanomassiliicoccales archaeon]